MDVDSQIQSVEFVISRRKLTNIRSYDLDLNHEPELPNVN